MQLKGLKYDVKLNPEGRKRRKKDITPVEKHKKGAAKARRAVYVGLVDKAIRLKVQNNINDQQPYIGTIQERYTCPRKYTVFKCSLFSESENESTVEPRIMNSLLCKQPV